MAIGKPLTSLQVAGWVELLNALAIYASRKWTLMKLEEAQKLVAGSISGILEGKAEVTPEMQLIGGDSLLDSMKLVEVCLALEDLADEHGFEFDWTSEAAMSKSRSMFRTVSSLAEEFAAQSGA